MLSITDIELQDVLFGYFDTDGTGDLGVGEMGRMFSAVNLFDTRRLVNSQGKALAILQNILIENDFDRTQFDSKKYKTKK